MIIINKDYLHQGNKMPASQNRLEVMIHALRDHDYKITPQRLAILTVLSESKDHPSVDSVFERVKKNFPTTSLATVYKNISILKALNQVLELGFGDGRNRYDGRAPYPHSHLICTQCRKVMDPDLSGIHHMTNELAEKTGYKIVDLRLDFYGLCPDCQEKSP